MGKHTYVILLSLTAILILMASTQAQELVPHANVPKDFSTIQQAIDNLAQAGTVEIENGTYYEYVRAYKSLSLVTMNGAVIDGRFKNYADSPWQIYVAGANSVTISGFRFLTTYSGRGAIGICVENCVDIAIINCTFEDTCGNGVELIGVSNARIFNNTIATFGTSILLHDCTNITITYNTLRDAGEQFQMYNSRNIVFHHNNVFNNESFYPRVSNTTCIWDDGRGQGNYWSDYAERYPKAKELVGLGIWDTPYQIDPDDVDGQEHFDYYPLVKDPQVSSDPTENGCGAGGKIPLMC